MLTQIISIAKAAGTIILSYYDNPTELSKKEGGSSLTEADLKANEFIVNKLSEHYREIPTISEEAEMIPYEKRKNWERFWLVDPLDGTAEFLERNGEFTVNIALIENGEPIIGVIYAPAKSLLYYAEKNKGAWKQENDQAPIRIFSREPNPTGKLTVVASRRHGSAELETFLENYDVQGTVSAGSSIKFCMMAEGKADQPWNGMSRQETVFTEIPPLRVFAPPHSSIISQTFAILILSLGSPLILFLKVP